LIGRQNANDTAIATLLFENYNTIGSGEQGVIHPDAYVKTRMMLGATLADNDIAGNGLLAAEQLNAKAFAVRLAAVLGTSFTFLVCHGLDGLKCFSRY
jgi:hypothetical protein